MKITKIAKRDVMWSIRKDCREKMINFEFANSRKFRMESQINTNEKIDSIVTYRPKKDGKIQGIRKFLNKLKR